MKEPLSKGITMHMDNLKSRVKKYYNDNKENLLVLGAVIATAGTVIVNNTRDSNHYKQTNVLTQKTIEKLSEKEDRILDLRAALATSEHNAYQEHLRSLAGTSQPSSTNVYPA